MIHMQRIDAHSELRRNRARQLEHDDGINTAAERHRKAARPMQLASQAIRDDPLEPLDDPFSAQPHP